MVLINGGSFYAACRGQGLVVDYRRLRDAFQDACHLVRINFYLALYEGDANEPVTNLLTWMSLNGFVIRSRRVPWKQVNADGSPRQKPRVDLDVEMAVDMLSASDAIDHIVMFTSSWNIVGAVEAVQRKGIRVTCVSTTDRVAGGAIDEDLHRQVDQFVDINDLRSVIVRV